MRGARGGGGEPVKTSEILRAARGLIETPDRWWTGDSSTCRGECALTAIDRVCGGSYETGEPAIGSLARVIGVADPCADIPRWNDAEGRTHAEVLAAFDTAIAYAEAAEQEFSPSACEPVEFDRWTPDMAAEALGEPEPKPMDYDEWVQAWKDLGK